MDTDLVSEWCIPTFWITGRSLPAAHTVQTHGAHTFDFEVLFEAGTEMCDTMCEADVSAVAAFQTHKPPTPGQIHAGGEEGGTDRLFSLHPQTLSWLLSAI